MSYINGIHHYMLNCNGCAEFEKAVAFYRDVLGLKVARTWGEGSDSGIMLDTGCGYVEIFANATACFSKGAIRHIALSTTDTDACFRAAVGAGCDVVDAPKDIVIPSNPPYPARIAFIKGPVGEEIEFFQVK